MREGEQTWSAPFLLSPSLDARCELVGIGLSGRSESWANQQTLIDCLPRSVQFNNGDQLQHDCRTKCRAACGPERRRVRCGHDPALAGAPCSGARSDSHRTRIDARDERRGRAGSRLLFVELLCRAAQQVERIGGVARTAIGFGGRGFLDTGTVAFARREKKIGFKAVLASVQIVVAASESVQRLVSAAFNDATGFDNQNLLGAANGREAMGDYERCAAAHEVTQTFLNERFRFRIQTGSGFIKNQDARIGEDGACDGDALLLPSGKFYAAFADYGVVFFFKGFGEFIHAGDAASFHNFFFAGFWPREGHIFANRTVEKKSILQDHAELSAIAAQLDGRQIGSIHQDAAAFRFIKRSDETNNGGFTRAGWADQRSDRAGQRDKINVEEDLLAGFIGKIHIFENYFASQASDGFIAAIVLIFDFFVQDFARALKAGDGFGELSTDGNNLENGSDQHGQKREISN